MENRHRQEARSKTGQSGQRRGESGKEGLGAKTLSEPPPADGLGYHKYPFLVFSFSVIGEERRESAGGDGDVRGHRFTFSQVSTGAQSRFPS